MAFYLQFSSSKLSKVTQLTGFSDPVYAEAYINVNQFDIVLDVLIVNQTSLSKYIVLINLPFKVFFQRIRT